MESPVILLRLSLHIKLKLENSKLKSKIFYLTENGRKTGQII